MTASKIPKTDSIAELAEFWDTHDLTDFEDELEEVSGPIFRRRSGGELRLHLGWILEKLKPRPRSPR